VQEELATMNHRERGGYSLLERAFFSALIVPIFILLVVLPFSFYSQASAKEIVASICIIPIYPVLPYFFFVAQRGLLRTYIIDIDSDRDVLHLSSSIFGIVDQSFEYKISEVKKVEMRLVTGADPEAVSGPDNGIWIHGTTSLGEDWELNITVFYKNSKEKGLEHRMKETAQKFGWILNTEVDSKKFSS
tara:strand:- start:298 stop:864 length:567 start_codon:yes stop_codon:yes gene_type:complete